MIKEHKKEKENWKLKYNEIKEENLKLTSQL
jgi:hypothetical protein